MNDQRLERVLRDGPPFATRYAVRSLPLAQAPAASIARVRPMVLLLAAVALLLVAFTTALIIGALRSSALGFTCANAADAMDQDTAGWTVSADDASGGGAEPGMLATFTRGDPPPPPTLIDPESGETCATVDFSPGTLLESDTQVRWSPSGDALAMVTTNDSADDMQSHSLLVVSGAGIVRSAVESDWPVNFEWSPDSHAVAVFSGFESFFARPVNVWIVPDDGSEAREMTIECGRCHAAPDGLPGWGQMIAWSPNGNRIAFAFMPAGRADVDQAESPAYRLWVGAADSGRLSELTGIPDLTLVRWLDDDTLVARDQATGVWYAIPVESPESLTEVEPSVPPYGLSPDGKYQMSITEDYALTITSLETGEVRTLYQEGEPGIGIAWETWSPDSKSVVFTRYYQSNSESVDGLWIATLDGDLRNISGEYDFAGPWQAAGN